MLYPTYVNMLISLKVLPRRGFAPPQVVLCMANVLIVLKQGRLCGEAAMLSAGVFSPQECPAVGGVAYGKCVNCVKTE